MNEKLNTQDRISLALHAAVIEKLMTDPEMVLERAKSNLIRWSNNYDTTPKWMKDWSEVLGRGVSAVSDVLVSKDEASTLLRASSPFTGVITQQERSDIMYVEREARRVFEDADKAGDWLTSSVSSLNHKTPIQAVLAGRSDGVINILRKIESGEFS